MRKQERSALVGVVMAAVVVVAGQALDHEVALRRAKLTNECAREAMYFEESPRFDRRMASMSMCDQQTLAMLPWLTDAGDLTPTQLKILALPRIRTVGLDMSLVLAAVLMAATSALYLCCLSTAPRITYAGIAANGRMGMGQEPQQQAVPGSLSSSS